MCVLLGHVRVLDWKQFCSQAITQGARINHRASSHLYFIYEISHFSVLPKCGIDYFLELITALLYAINWRLIWWINRAVPETDVMTMKSTFVRSERRAAVWFTYREML